jgi:hypothetical protein
LRHGHISTLHIWWARRPLAACRAVICASLWPDPADSMCPPMFIDKAREEMLNWTAHERQQLLSHESQRRFEKARIDPAQFHDALELRSALLDFIADFSTWDESDLFGNEPRSYKVCARIARGNARYFSTRCGPICRWRVDSARGVEGRR